MSSRKITFLVTSALVVLTLLSAALFGQGVPKGNIYRYLSIFTEVYSLVRSSYVEEVPQGKLVEGAFNGVTDAIDEYSFYIPPDQFAAYRKFVEDQPIDDIGVIATKRFGYAYVIAPIDGSPAADAGVKGGDFIEKINGSSTQNLSIWQIRSALTVPEGSALKLVILRGGMSTRESIEVKAKKFDPDDASYERYGSVAYVRLPHFQKGAAQSLFSRLGEAREAGLKKLIIDLRENAAGDYAEAAAAADELLSGGVITSVSGRRAESKRWTADQKTSFDGTVQLLIDQSTAGPAEVFAASLLGNKRASLVGTSSYGRAIEQKLVGLPSGGAVYLTIAHYTTPDLKPIKEQGVRPDTTVDLATLALEGERKDADPILEKALKVFGESRKALKNAA